MTSIRRRLIALAALAFMWAPNATFADSHADDKNQCNVPAEQQPEECLERRGFQTRFFN